MLQPAGTVVFLGIYECVVPAPVMSSASWQSKRVCVTCRTLRQQRSAILIFTENLVQCINLTFYTMPNVYLLKRPCGLTDSFILWSIWVRWTCWNTVGALPCMRTCVWALCTIMCVLAGCCCTITVFSFTMTNAPAVALPAAVLTQEHSSIFASPGLRVDLCVAVVHAVSGACVRLPGLEASCPVSM